MNPEKLVNTKVRLPTHFSEPVVVESTESVGKHHKLRVRNADGYLEEVILTKEEIEEIGEG